MGVRYHRFPIIFQDGHRSLDGTAMCRSFAGVTDRRYGANP